MIFYFAEHVMGWGGVGIIPNRSVAPLHDLLAFLLRYMIFYFTEHVMGWGGVGTIPNRSVAPLHDLLAFLSYAT